jgi:acetyl esterase/lipase
MEDATIMTANDRRRPDIPEDLLALMRDVGPKWRTNVSGNVDLMIQRFSEVLKDSPRDGVVEHRDIRYGDHERQVLDVFLPELESRPPLVVFVHGGAFVSGHRNRSEQIYSNVLVYLAQYGIAGVNVGYRLANDTEYPGATQDIARVIAWTRQQATQYGWDPAKIFLMSHSAGGAHAGSYGYDPRFRPADGSQLAGIIFVSGRVRADNLPENPNAKKVERYYGPDASKYEDYSAVTHVGPESLPTFVAWAEFENPLIDVYSAELVYRLADARRKAPPSMWLPGHNHTSAIGHIGTSDERLGQAIVEFIRNPR